jgi:hypothetical protein
MTAQPIHEDDPYDPVEILRLLPAKWHEPFLAEYEAAVRAAQRVERYRTLHDLLRLWRMRAIAFSDPDFETGFQAAAEGRSEEFVPAEQVFPGWADRR